MHNLSWTSAVDALSKIEALAAAAQFLTANTTEKQLSLELMAVVEDIARKAQEKSND
ncbi:hypothetical protein MUA04_23930 [Enterobacteriaceae bacterium H11S18]|uniref:hypothetical protein n=1 Tax=Dryocola clanedunensis TaxID=2925396 RepID=UPI0022F04E44|nr:hypothetical protein [Dryocola clanedunensis]MCT4713224.1 hypothetical protein [Dryocola clanedunensis]